MPHNPFRTGSSRVGGPGAAVAACRPSVRQAETVPASLLTPRALRPVPVFGPTGKIIARVLPPAPGSLGGGVLTKKCSRSRHFLRRPPAICVDAAAYDEFRHLFESIEVQETDGGTTFRVPADVFDRRRLTMDRGFGRQYAVSLPEWEETDAHGAHVPGSANYSVAPTPPPTASLFGADIAE